MPLMPRFSKKGTKVAFDILGVPPNLRKTNGKKVRTEPYSSNADSFYGNDLLFGRARIT